MRSQSCHQVVILSFVANYAVAENSRSASTDVGGRMLDNALNSCSNLLGLLPALAFQMSKKTTSRTIFKDFVFEQ